MTNRPAIAVVFAVMSLTSASCSLLLNDDFSGPGANVTSPDGSTTPTDANVLLPEGGGGAGDGAAADAGDADGGIAGESCATATFCDDFDKGAVGAKWSRVEVRDGLFSLVNTGPVVSPPNALYMQLFLQDAGSPIERRAFMETSFSFPSRIKCRSQVLLESAPVTSGDLELLTFSANNGTFSRYQIFIKVTHDDLVLFEDTKVTSSSNTDSNELHTPHAPRGKWLRFTLDIDLAGKKASFDVDGAQPYVLPLNPPTSAPFTTVSIGDPGDNEETPAIAVRYDDFWCNVTP